MNQPDLVFKKRKLNTIVHESMSLQDIPKSHVPGPNYVLKTDVYTYCSITNLALIIIQINIISNRGCSNYTSDKICCFFDWWYRKFIYCYFRYFRLNNWIIIQKWKMFLLICWWMNSWINDILMACWYWYNYNHTIITKTLDTWKIG